MGIRYSLILKEVYHLQILGRTLLKWRPRRFGGGRGYMRLTKEEIERMDREEKERQKKIDHEER